MDQMSSLKKIRERSEREFFFPSRKKNLEIQIQNKRIQGLQKEWFGITTESFWEWKQDIYL